MFADRSTSLLSRSGPALAVVGAHLLVAYGLIVATGIVELPKFAQPIEAIFIPEQQSVEPQPEIPVVKPEIENTLPVEEPPPEVQFEESVAPPADIPIPASDSAISATQAAAAVAQDLKATNRVEPAYPPTSRRMGEEGTVRLKVLVNERGRPQDVTIVKSSGYPRLDEAAIDAVRRWRFAAATDGSQPITAWTQVAITFRLTQA